MAGRSRCHNGTDFHTLGNKARMIVFSYFPGSQTNLVAIGTISCSRFRCNLLLRKLAFQRFRQRSSWIPGSGYAHSLIYIGTSGERITDTSAKAGSGPAKRFNFRWMIVCFILKQEEPVLIPMVGIHSNLNSACIDFFGLIHFGEFSLTAKGFDRCRSHIHQGNRTFGVLPIESDSGGFVIFQRIPHRFCKFSFFTGNIFQCCGKGGMAAMIRPVRIKHPDFCFGRISFFHVPEIIPHHNHIGMTHRQSHAGDNFVKPLVIHTGNSGNARNIAQFFYRKIECLCRRRGSFSGFHRIDQEFQDSGPVFVFKMPGKYIMQCAAHADAILPCENGQALFC